MILQKRNDMPPRIYSNAEIRGLTDQLGFGTINGRKEYLERRMVFEGRRHRSLLIADAQELFPWPDSDDIILFWQSCKSAFSHALRNYLLPENQNP
jgi:hypothetical protein